MLEARLINFKINRNGMLLKLHRSIAQEIIKNRNTIVIPIAKEEENRLKEPLSFGTYRIVRISLR